MAFTYDSLSPIHWVSSVASPSEAQKVFVKSPSKFDYELEDVSEADAGRTEDGNMQKMMIGQVNKVIMEWSNIHTPVASELMQIFKAEYFYANFLDPYTGSYHTEYMYRGNISASMYSNWDGVGVWTIGFNLIRVNGGSLINANNL